MLLRIDCPFISKQVEQGRLARWNVAPGEAIAFGDDLCVIDVAEVTQLNRRGSRHLRRRAKVDDWVAQKKVDFSVAVTASDAGYLWRLLVEEGDELTVGAPMAIASTEPTESHGDDVDVASLPVFRTLANDGPEGDADGAETC